MSFGDGFQGQLGQGTMVMSCDRPQVISLEHKIVQVSCGESHTAVITGIQEEILSRTSLRYCLVLFYRKQTIKSYSSVGTADTESCASTISRTISPSRRQKCSKMSTF